MKNTTAALLVIAAFATGCCTAALWYRPAENAPTADWLPALTDTAAQPETLRTQRVVPAAEAPEAQTGGVPAPETVPVVETKNSVDALVPAEPPQPKETVQRSISDGGDGPRLALVLDDCGHNVKIVREISALGLTLTWAIIPEARYARQTADFATEIGQPFIVHIPMQAVSDPDGSKEYVIGTDTPEEKIVSYVSDLYSRFPNAVGANNHRGSKATSDWPTMRRFMKAYAATGWPFLDSRTIGKTIANQAAVEYDIPVVQNKCFIDGTPDMQTMKEQFTKALHAAKKNGKSVAICHAREKTLPFLRWLSRQDLAPVRLVTLEELWYERQGTQGGRP